MQHEQVKQTPVHDAADESACWMRRLYEQHGQMIYHICLNYLKNPTDAEDGVQEVFLRCHLHRAHLSDEQHLKHWLIRTAVNYCKDQLKSFWRRKVDLKEILAWSEPLLPDTDEQVLLHKLVCLPEKQWICLYLHYVHEYSLAEIATALGLRLSSVKMRLKRGRDALRAEKEGISR